MAVIHTGRSAAGLVDEHDRGASAVLRPIPDWLIVGVLVVVAVLSRIFTTNSLAGEPTSDEYLYGVYARDLARSWFAGGGFHLNDALGEGRLIATLTAALSLVVSWDQITLGRAIQALFNALCVPATHVLGRRLGLPRAAAAVAALLLLAAPEFLEFAWRFWADSQATFLGLLYLVLLVGLARRPSVREAVGATVVVLLLFATKESAAAAFAPLLPAVLLVLGLRRLRTWRGRALVLLGVTAVFAAGLLILFGESPLTQFLARQGPFRRTFLTGPLILGSAELALPALPGYVDQVTGFLAAFQLGVGLLWAWALGSVWLVAQTLYSLFEARTEPVRAVGWSVSMLLWAPLLTFPVRGLNALGQPEAWVVLAAAGFLVGASLVALGDLHTQVWAWGFTLLGTLFLGLVVERLIISVSPEVGSGAALGFRTFMPIAPAIALLAGVGVWSAAGTIRLFLPSIRPAHSLVALAAALALVIVWSPLIRERVTTVPLLGRPADRGADPTTPQGLRVEALVEAQDWLRANLRSTDRTITGIPRHLAWYADLGVAGMGGLIDLGAQIRTPAERRGFIQERTGPTGVDYVVDFNVDWTQPDSDRAREWRETFDWLASQSNLEVAYLLRDPFGHPVFYVVRNHGYALGPTAGDAP